MGAAADRKKDRIAVADGYRESEQSRKELLPGVKARDLDVEPSLAIGDGALGFWKADGQIWPSTWAERCGLHKTSNIMNKLLKGVQTKAKEVLIAIYEVETKAEAEEAFDLSVTTYEAKYPKATECLAKDREALLMSFDLPAEHLRHMRTTNAIESTFATVRLRTLKTNGSGSRSVCLTIVFKLVEIASKAWRSLNGSPRLPGVVSGGKFVDGIEVKDAA